MKENERNKPMEGKRVLCWTVIKKEKMGIKYIMGHRGKKNIHTNGKIYFAVSAYSNIMS